jgi:branched-chain amino acid aminotransferase
MSAFPLVWFEGRLVDATKPIIAATDHGLLLGDGVFDSLSVRDGAPRWLDRHLARLAGGLSRLGIASVDDAVLRGAIDELVTASGLDDARVRITVTSGPGRDARIRGDSPTVVITIDEIGPPLPPAALVTVDAIRNERSPLIGVKLTSWAENAAILRSAVAAGADNAVLCDSRGNLSECTTSNLFLVVDDELVTPSLGSGCLPGIVRSVLVEHGVAVERVLPATTLDRATEVFITSSTTGVRPVYRIDGRDLPTVDGLRTRRATECLTAVD